MMMEGFSALVLRAATDESEWRSVLKSLIAATGARIGVMSLRDLDTAELAFPNTAATTLSAPLIVGIEAEFVSSYFDHYAALDTWTEVEKAQYPHAPYFMSDHLPLATLRETEFYQGWLQPQGVCECLVAEVFLSRKHWIALNLLFAETTSARRIDILSVVEQALPSMRMGWQLSERLLGLSFGQIASVGYLENAPAPCMLLDEDHVVTSINAKGVEEFAEHLPLAEPPAPGRPLRWRHNASGTAFEMHLHRLSNTGGSPSPPTIASDRAGYVLQASVLAQGSDVVGKRRAQICVVAKADVQPANRGAPVPRIWDQQALTPAQAAIIRWIAEGGHASDYAAKTGITKKTAYDHLFAARQKLGGISARDIYTSHQTLLATEMDRSE